MKDKILKFYEDNPFTTVMLTLIASIPLWGFTISLYGIGKGLESSFWVGMLFGLFIIVVVATLIATAGGFVLLIITLFNLFDD